MRAPGHRSCAGPACEARRLGRNAAASRPRRRATPARRASARCWRGIRWDRGHTSPVGLRSFRSSQLILGAALAAAGRSAAGCRRAALGVQRPRPAGRPKRGTASPNIQLIRTIRAKIPPIRRHRSALCQLPPQKRTSRGACSPPAPSCWRLRAARHPIPGSPQVAFGDAGRARALDALI